MMKLRALVVLLMLTCTHLRQAPKKPKGDSKEEKALKDQSKLLWEVCDAVRKATKFLLDPRLAQAGWQQCYS